MDPAGSSGKFTTTHWSQVAAAGRAEPSVALDALEQLARTYQYPIYAEIRRQGHPDETARDLTQSFFVRLLSGNFFARASATRGRFRNYLLTALNHFLADDWRHRTRESRGGGQTPLSLDDDTLEDRYRLEPIVSRTPAEIYERRFALTLLEEVLRRLEKEFVSFGSADLFARLQIFLIGEGESSPGYATLAAELGLTPGAVKAAVYRLRRRYRELLREEISRIVGTPEEVEDELQYIFRLLTS